MPSFTENDPAAEDDGDIQNKENEEGTAEKFRRKRTSRRITPKKHRAATRSHPYQSIKEKNIEEKTKFSL